MSTVAANVAAAAGPARSGAGLRIAVAVSRYNDLVTTPLLDGARAALAEAGVADVTVVFVPGAFELPLAAQALLAAPGPSGGSDRFDAVVLLGCVIRGETPHFDYVCDQAAAGAQRVALGTGRPVVFGVLTTDTLGQALARAGGAVGNKGAEAAAVAVEMAVLLREIAAGTNA